MKRPGKRIGIAMLCTALALAAAPWLIVRVLAVEPDALGVRVEAVPDEARALYWARIGGDGEAQLPEDASLRLLWRVYEASEAPDPALRLAMTATIPQLPRSASSSKRLWRLRYAASIVWLSRHWTATQALSAVLERAHYGHRLTGLEAAARGYYGRNPAELTRGELASLVVTANRVVRFNPWCRRSENAEAVSQLLGRVAPAADEPTDPLTRLRPVPHGACPKR
jgi:hypothetical protein